MNAEEHIRLARNDLLELEGKIEVAREELSTLVDDINQARTTLQDAESAYEKRKDEIGVSTIEIESTLTALGKQVETENTLKQELVDKSASLRLENAKLEEANKVFREYEGKATKALDTRDDLLQARTKDIDAREQLISNRESFLPKS